MIPSHHTTPWRRSTKNSPSPRWGSYWRWASAAEVWLQWPLSWNNRTPWEQRRDRECHQPWNSLILFITGQMRSLLTSVCFPQRGVQEVELQRNHSVGKREAVTQLHPLSLILNNLISSIIIDSLSVSGWSRSTGGLLNAKSQRITI